MNVIDFVLVGYSLALTESMDEKTPLHSHLFSLSTVPAKVVLTGMLTQREQMMNVTKVGKVCYRKGRGGLLPTQFCQTFAISSSLQRYTDPNQTYNDE